MIKNYLKIFIKIAGQNKLFTSLSLFGISLTIMFIMIFSMSIEKITGGSGPEADLKKIIFTGYVKTKEVERTQGGGGNTNVGYCGRALGEEHLKRVTSAEVISMYSGAYSWEFIFNGQFQLRSQNQTDAEYWDVFDYRFLMGRPYRQEEVINQANLAVITRSLKELLFGEEADVLGRTVYYTTLNLTVIGVVEDPPVTSQNARGDLYFPYTLLQDASGSYTGRFRIAFKAGSAKQFKAIRNEAQEIITRLNAADTTYSSILLAGPFTQLEKMMAGYSDPGDYSRVNKIIRFLMIALAFILIPAVNLMAINFLRIHERCEEIAVRKSFGASSSVLRGQFLFENILMTLTGGIIGIILSYIMVALLGNSLLRLNVMNYSLPLTFSFNLAVFAAALVSCLLFSMFSGYLPAIRLSRMRPAVYLKGGEI